MAVMNPSLRQTELWAPLVEQTKTCHPGRGPWQVRISPCLDGDTMLIMGSDQFRDEYEGCAVSHGLGRSTFG